MFNLGQKIVDLSEHTINELSDINSTGTNIDSVITKSLWQIYFPSDSISVEIQILDSGTIDEIFLGNIATWQYSIDNGSNYITPGSYTIPNLTVTVGDLILIKIITFTSGYSGTMTIQETKS